MDPVSGLCLEQLVSRAMELRQVTEHGTGRRPLGFPVSRLAITLSGEL